MTIKSEFGPSPTNDIWSDSGNNENTNYDNLVLM